MSICQTGSLRLSQTKAIILGGVLQGSVLGPILFSLYRCRITHPCPIFFFFFFMSRLIKCSFLLPQPSSPVPPATHAKHCSQTVNQSCRSHITPILIFLYWLLIKYRIDFYMLTLHTFLNLFIYSPLPPQIFRMIVFLLVGPHLS